MSLPSPSPSPSPPALPPTILGYVSEADKINPIPPRKPTRPLSEPDDPIQLHFLVDKQEFIPVACTATWHEWNAIYRDCFDIQSPEAAIAELRKNYLNRDTLNTCFVATIDGEFAGTAMLTTEDMLVCDTYYGTRPWIATLYVDKKYRGRGVASKLINRLSERAQEMGFYHCWLITQHMQRAYEKCGYRCIDNIEAFGGDPYTVMRRDFSRDGRPVKILTERDAQEAHKRIHAKDTH